MSANQHPKQFLFINEVSQATGLHPNTIRRLIRLGDIRSLRLGRRYLIPETELERFDYLAQPGHADGGQAKSDNQGSTSTA